MAQKRHRVAILWRGDREMRRTATARDTRYGPVFEALLALGVDALPVVYADDVTDEVREFMTFDGVLVRVNAIDEGRPRHPLDAVLPPRRP